MSNASEPPASRLRPSLDWLLAFVPIAIGLRFFYNNPTLLFIVSCLAVIPLAGIMGRATESLAEHAGQGIGGLLNATFGNAAELIIALIALSKGLTGVVKASITGSIIGNLLLVLGLSFIAGGLKFSEQKFNQTAARSGATALTLAAIALIVPSVFHHVAGAAWTGQKEQHLSLGIAIVLLLTYACTLLFSLKTHKQLFLGTNHHEAAPMLDESGAPLEAPEAEHVPWSLQKSIVVLLIATCFVALMSEFLVGSVEAARGKLGLTEVFVGVIVVAIIGNAAEHSSAVMAAVKNKMDLSLGIAIGSSLQIALFVAPVLLLASYAFGRPMDLEFKPAEIVAIVLAIGITAQISGDGESNWLEGAQLLSVYLILGILFFFLPDTPHPAAVHP